MPTIDYNSLRNKKIKRPPSERPPHRILPSSLIHHASPPGHDACEQTTPLNQPTLPEPRTSPSHVFHLAARRLVKTGGIQAPEGDPRRHPAVFSAVLRLWTAGATRLRAQPGVAGTWVHAPSASRFTPSVVYPAHVAPLDAVLTHRSHAVLLWRGASFSLLGQHSKVANLP